MSWNCRWRKWSSKTVCVLFPVLFWYLVRSFSSFSCSANCLDNTASRDKDLFVPDTDTHALAGTHTHTHTHTHTRIHSYMHAHMHRPAPLTSWPLFCFQTFVFEWSYWLPNEMQAHSWFSSSWQFNCLGAVKKSRGQRSSVCVKMNHSIV